jgi:hypothetical protein
MSDAKDAARRLADGSRVMQCHKSTDAKPKPCQGFLSVVGHDSVAVRIGVMAGLIDHDDVGRRVAGLYRSISEMVREADGIEMEGTP